MPQTLPINADGDQVTILQSSISAITDEVYSNARKLTGTGIVGFNDQIDVGTETYMGQIRWNKPLNPKINIASLTDATDGQKTNSAQDYLRYIKTVRTHGSGKVNMASVVTQTDGLAKIGRDFGETRAQDEHNALLSILKGVALSEALTGAANGGLGGQTFGNDPTSKSHGFYVDLGTQPLVQSPQMGASGGMLAAPLLNAFGMAYKDYEPEYMYLAASPQQIAQFRQANLIDSDRITDGNINFETLFGGKFRLISTRANQGLGQDWMTALKSSTTGVALSGTKTTFLIHPGAIALQELAVEVPVEIERKAAAYQGGGTTDIWYRWGYVMAPAGYDWRGSESAFPSDADYAGFRAGANAAPLLPTQLIPSDLKSITGVWERKFTSALSLGILPIFHS